MNSVSISTENCLDSCGANTKAAVIRLGMVEILSFVEKFYDDVKKETFFESCGVADLIASCYGGRNRKCAELFVRTGKVEHNIFN